jgi:hypothetical protein
MNGLICQVGGAPVMEVQHSSIIPSNLQLCISHGVPSTLQEKNINSNFLYLYALYKTQPYSLFFSYYDLLTRILSLWFCNSIMKPKEFSKRSFWEHCLALPLIFFSSHHYDRYNRRKLTFSHFFISLFSHSHYPLCRRANASLCLWVQS